MINKRGDISTTILVIGVFAICGIALLSFYFSGIDSKESFSRIEIIKNVNLIANEIKFYKNSEVNKNPEEIMTAFTEKNNDSNVVYSAKKEGDSYKVIASYYENKYDFFIFGFGEKTPTFTVEHTISPS